MKWTWTCYINYIDIEQKLVALNYYLPIVIRFFVENRFCIASQQNIVCAEVGVVLHLISMLSKNKLRMIMQVVCN